MPDLPFANNNPLQKKPNPQEGEAVILDEKIVGSGEPADERGKVAETEQTDVAPSSADASPPKAKEPVSLNPDVTGITPEQSLASEIPSPARASEPQAETPPVSGMALHEQQATDDEGLATGYRQGTSLADLRARVMGMSVPNAASATAPSAPLKAPASTSASPTVPRSAPVPPPPLASTPASSPSSPAPAAPASIPSSWSSPENSPAPKPEIHPEVKPEIIQPVPPVLPAQAELAGRVQAAAPNISEPPVSRKQEAQKKKPPSLVQAMHTFRSDAMRVVDRNKVSLVGAVAAEENRRQEEEAQRGKGGNGQDSRMLSAGAIYMLGIATTLVVFGGLLFFIVQFVRNTPAPPLVEGLPTIVFVEEQRLVDLTAMRRSEAMQTLMEETTAARVRIGAITQLYPTLTTPQLGNEPLVRLMRTDEFLALIAGHQPASLVRALTDRFVLGVHEFERNEPFLLLEVSDYDNAYGGMLLWERDLNDDLAPLFGPSSLNYYRTPRVLRYRDAVLEGARAGTSTATTTASATTSPPAAPVGGTSTPPSLVPIFATSSEVVLGRTFEDSLVRNKEVRVLRASDGSIAIMYAFIERNLLAITTNEYTLIELISRLSSRRFF